MKNPNTVLLTLLLCVLSVSFSVQAQDHTYYNNLAKEEYNNKKYYSAIDYATRSLNSKLNGEAYWWRGMARYYLNNYSDASDDFGNAIPYYSSDRVSLGNLYSWRGDCRLAQKLNDDAIRDYELALSYGFENKLHLYWSEAEAYYRNGNFKRAEEYYTSAITVASQAEDLSKLYKYRGDAKGYLYKYDEAIADFSKALEYDPRFVRAFWQRGYYRAKKLQYELAIGDYTAAIGFVDRDKAGGTADLVILYNNRGLHHYQLKHYAESLADLGESLKLNPGYDYANWNMGRTLAAMHRYQDATRYYLMAVSLMQQEKDRASCYADLYWTDRAQLDYRQAVVHITEAVRLNPDNSTYRWNRAYVLRVTKEYALALIDYENAITRYQDDSANLRKLYGERAVVKMQMKDAGGALQDLQKAVQLNQASYRPHYDLGWYYKEVLKQNDLASIHLQKAADLSSLPDTTVNYAYAKAIKGDRLDAIRMMEKLLKQESANPERLKWELYNAGCIYILTGNSSRGLQYLDQALLAGFDDYDHMHTDRDLDIVRQTPAFKALLVKYKLPIPKL